MVYKDNSLVEIYELFSNYQFMQNLKEELKIS
jgi:hypothetical protein